MSLNKESLELLRQKVDLVDLLSSYMTIKRNGAYYKGCCPFHEEKTPSFVVQAGASFYHCFGCQAHGDAIAFLMQHQHLSFIEAVEHLAQRYQVVLEYDDQQKETGPNKKRHLELLNHAHQFFYKYLCESVDAESARKYLAQRGLDQKFITNFEIGLAPTDGKKLIRHLNDLKYTSKEIEEVGLLNQYGSSFFFDRITFPIRDAQGHVIAFSARLYKEQTQGGKYINSKETFLFKKSNVLFGLNYSRTRIAKSKKVLIVEGQIDALRLIHQGLNATVAPLGTALTEQHIDKLKQLGIEEAYLAFDADSAGQNAALKSGDLLQKKKITTYIIPIPPKYDPDLFVREKGIKEFVLLFERKIEYLSFMLQVFSERIDLSNPANKARVVDKVVQKIKEWEDPVMVHESLKKLAQLLQLPESTLGLTSTNTPHTFAPKKNLKHESTSTKYFLEMEVLTWLVQNDLPTDELVKIANKNITIEYFENSECKALYQIIEQGFKEQKALDTLSLLVQSPTDVQKLITELLGKKIRKEEAKEGFVQALQRLLEAHWMRKRDQISQKIHLGAHSEEESLKLAKEFDQIKQKRPQVVL